jgi:hypothetical protein
MLIALAMGACGFPQIDPQSIMHDLRASEETGGGAIAGRCSPGYKQEKEAERARFDSGSRIFSDFHAQGWPNQPLLFIIMGFR